MELMNGVHDKMGDMINGVMGQLDEMQPNPIGTSQRSEKERRGFWDAITNMESEERQKLFSILAPVMQHSGPDFDDCELCDFVKDMSGAGSLNGANTTSERHDQRR